MLSGTIHATQTFLGCKQGAVVNYNQSQWVVATPNHDLYKID